MMRRNITGLLLVAAASLCLDCSPSAETRATPKPATADVQKLTDANFDAVVLRSEVPVLVDFWAVWCGPCKQQAPIVEELAKTYAGRAVMGKLDVDRNRRTATKYAVEGLPTLILFKDGKVAGKSVGLTTKQTLVAALDASLQ
jgi:thioredoxin 1